MQTGVGDSKIGRNDLCPCGSGRKYKKCCGKSDTDAATTQSLSSPWLIRRQLLLGIAVVSGLLVDTGALKLTWFAAVSIAISFALIVLGWLALKKNRSLNPYSGSDRPDIDWSDPCSLFKPFLPVTRYPVHFFLIVSVMALAGGAAAVIRGMMTGAEEIMTPARGFLLLLGISTLIVLLPWLQQCRFDNHTADKG